MDQENESENDQDQDKEVQSTLDDTFGRGFDDIADTKRYTGMPKGGNSI